MAGLTRTDILEKVKKIIAEQLSVDSEEITLETHLVDDLKADSMDMVEMVMAMEEEFGMEIPDEEAEKLTRVEAIVKYVEQRLQEKE